MSLELLLKKGYTLNEDGLREVVSCILLGLSSLRNHDPFPSVLDSSRV